MPIDCEGTPNDVASWIAFFASKNAIFMAGAGLIVDGGITAMS